MEPDHIDFWAYSSSNAVQCETSQRFDSPWGVGRSKWFGDIGPDGLDKKTVVIFFKVNVWSRAVNQFCVIHHKKHSAMFELMAHG